MSKKSKKENNKNTITSDNEHDSGRRIYLSEKKSKEIDIKKNNDNDNYDGIFKTVMNRKNFLDYLSLDKEYKELLKNNKLLKDQLNTLRDKEKLFQKKYSGIISIYKTALDELMKDEEVTEKKNIY